MGEHVVHLARKAPALGRQRFAAAAVDHQFGP
jgi:hypothetical protein